MCACPISEVGWFQPILEVGQGHWAFHTRGVRLAQKRTNRGSV